ncbi:hypothetical protein H0G86_000845 [Trichoderma simmonsii]|uniref:Uncharacterized protein n=1 Tax=Trichoderma simmonsii TaxID=1491479 RepID=A0A8G0L5Q1_9HYPO|nr:hypothetical protein H0G86_000845 [Trichoderma simmonsii]
MGIITSAIRVYWEYLRRQVTNDEGLGREQGQRPSLVAETVGDEPSQRPAKGHDTPPRASAPSAARAFWNPCHYAKE